MCAIDCPAITVNIVSEDEEGWLVKCGECGDVWYEKKKTAVKK